MSMWTAIVAIVAVVMVAEVCKYAIKSKNKRESNETANVGSAKLVDLEKRVESLETIILEMEKENRYRDLK